MRIAFLLTTSLNSPYGVGRCFPLARQIASFGHQVHVVALHHDFGPTIPRHFKREGVWVHYVGQMHVRKVADTTTYFSPLKLLWVVMIGAVGLVRQAVALQADVYHIGKPHPQNSLAGLLAARLLRGRRLFLDCDDLEAAANRFSNAWQQRGMAWLEDGLPRLVDGLTVHTRFLEARFQALGVAPDRILRLPNGIDSHRFRPVVPADTANWRERLGVGNQRVVMYVGTLSLVNHPVDLLLEAFAKLAPRVWDVVLLLVGGGPDLSALKALACQLGIADRCRFAGRVEPDQVPILLSLAYVSVDPVYDDEVARARWPLKIMESLAARVPVVTGDVGDRREMLGEGAAGLLVSPGDPEALANGLEAVLSDPFLHQSLSAGCKSQATRYTLEDLSSSLLTFYEQVPR
jgi:glycosyltransferase involved in cell wall biosynthesis